MTKNMEQDLVRLYCYTPSITFILDKLYFNLSMLFHRYQWMIKFHILYYTGIP